MKHLPYYWSPSCSRSLVLVKLLAICLFILASAKRVHAKTLYVSKASGDDSNNTCQNVTSPCKTLSYVIDLSSSNDVIMVDARGTTFQPYNNCSCRPVIGSLSLKSWRGFAVINCSGDGLVFLDADSKRSGDENVVDLGEVRLYGLKFIDTAVNLSDVSLVVTNCTFTSSLSTRYSFLYIIDISVSPERNLSANLNVTITDSNFTENVAGCLRVANRARAEVFVEIGSSFFIDNTLPKLENLILLLGLVSFNFLNSEISNTIFQWSGTWANPPSVMRLSSRVVASESRGLGLRNGSLLSNAYLQDETPSVLSVRFSGGNFHGNKAKVFFALLSSSFRLVIVDTNFSKNTDSYKQAGVVVVYAEGTQEPIDVHFKNCWFSSNQAVAFGTVIRFKVDRVVPSNVLLENCHFNDNRDGLAFELYGSGAPVNIYALQLSLSVISCVFNHNRASMSGAAYVETSQHSNLRFNRTIVESCSSRWTYLSEGYAGGITVVIHDYTAQQGDGISAGLGLWIDQCEFINNSAGLYGSGAVVVKASEWYSERYRSGLPSVAYITITGSRFVNNTAQYGTGGISCISASNIHFVITDTLFVDNAGYKAGGVYFSGGNLILQNCTLNNNYGGSTASSFASGSVRLGDNVKALIRDCKIVQGKITQSFRSLHFHGEVGLSSEKSSSLSLVNSTFDFNWKPSIEAVIVMELSQSNLATDNYTIIRCPVGYDVQTISDHEATDGKFENSFQCRLCPLGTYSEDRGYYRSFEKHSIECLECPYGAKCTMGLQVLPNFWGYKINSDPPMLAFSVCPSGYCCQPESIYKTCLSYNTCNDQRQGRLCGECKPEFSETLFAPSCRRSEKCNDLWFWPVAVFFVLGFSFCLILEPNFILIVWNWVTWFSHASSQGNAAFDPGYGRIVFFYYQAADVLILKTYIDVWDNHLRQFVLGLFNFEIRLNKEGFACPFPGLNPVSKILFRILGVFSVLFAIPTIFALHCLLCFCLRRARPKNGPYLFAFVKAILLGYAVLTEKSLRLLKCVEVNGVNCLFVNCNIHCYTWWQSIIGISVVVLIFPFALVLFFGSYKLFSKKISVFHFLLACFFPLPYLSYWFLTRRAFRTSRHVPDSDGRDAITSLLTGSYRAPDREGEKGRERGGERGGERVGEGDYLNRGDAIYWESVLIARILILILADVFIDEPFLRSLALIFVCVINLSVHIHVFPFKLVTANRVETLSLFCLVLIAMFNVPYYGYLSEGVVPSGPISHIMVIFSWCQAVLVSFLPFVCIFLVLVAMVSQAVRLFCLFGKLFCCICCRRSLENRNKELSDSLVTS